MLSLLTRAWKWFCNLFETPTRQDQYNVARTPSFTPEKASRDTLYIEVRGEWVRWAHLKCPCGCGDIISLNLMPAHQPNWQVVWHQDSVVSLSPSVNRVAGCRSHFFIQKNEVVWAK